MYQPYVATRPEPPPRKSNSRSYSGVRGEREVEPGDTEGRIMVLEGACICGKNDEGACI